MLVDFEALLVQEASAAQAAFYLPFDRAVCLLDLFSTSYPNTVDHIGEATGFLGNTCSKLCKSFELLAVSCADLGKVICHILLSQDQSICDTEGFAVVQIVIEAAW